MRFLSFLFLIFLSTFLHAQKKEVSIPWNEDKALEWENYEARPDKLNAFKAVTSTGISFDLKYSSNLITIAVENHFYPKQSWTKNKESADLLEHERLHFDIAELFARKLRKEISTTKFNSSGKELMNEISEIYSKKMKELNEYQSLYDKETDHSVKTELQKKWEEKVRKEIIQLNDFSLPTITLLIE